MMTTVYLVRHAESEPNRKIPEPKWPLSVLGQEQAINLISILTDLEVTKLYSSPYHRAFDTVKPFANKMKLEIIIDEDFRERKLTNGFVDDFFAILSKSWKDFNFKLPACESSRECQIRFKEAFQRILRNASNENIVIASHGNAIGLFLNHIDSNFTFEDWKMMKNSDIFKIKISNNSFHWDKTFNLNLK